MALPQSHISLSLLIAVAYSVFGIFGFNFPPEHVVLASVVVVVAGLLPNIDQGGGGPAKEFGTVVAAVAPLAVLQFFPEISKGGVARMTLLVVACYVLTRLIVVRGLQKYTVHRGMIHSVPAAVITGELTYLLFWDLPLANRIFLCSAAFAGFMSHLLLDASGNIDIVGRATGKAQPKTPVLKFLGPTWGSTFAIYACVGVLGWFIAQDFYPGLGIYAGVTY